MNSDHPVEVDDEAVRASLSAAAELGAPAPGVTQGAPVEDLAPACDDRAWITEARLLASFLDHKIAPNWQVTPEVREEWAAALSACLGKTFKAGPGDVSKWSPWGKLLYFSAAWAMCGFDMENFKFRQMQIAPTKKTAVTSTDAGDEAGAPGSQEAPSSGGSFSTMG